MQFFSYILNDYSVHIILCEELSLDKKIKNLDETFEYAPNEQEFQHFLLVLHLLEYYNEDKLYERVSDRSQVAMQESKDIFISLETESKTEFVCRVVKTRCQVRAALIAI